MSLVEEKEKFFELFRNNPRCPSYEEIPKDLTSDIEVLKLFVKRNPLGYFSMKEEFQTDPVLFTQCLKSNPEFYMQYNISSKKLFQDLKKDKEIARIAIQLDWRNYLGLDESLKIDRELIKLTAKTYSKDSDPSLYSFKFVLDEELQQDGEFAFEIISDFPYYYTSISKELKKNVELAELFVAENGNNFEFLPETLKKNREISLVALRKSPTIFKLLDDSFTNEFEFLSIISRHTHLSEIQRIFKLLKDKQMIHKLIRDYPRCFEVFPVEYIDDEIGLLLVKFDHKFFSKLSSTLRANLEIAKVAISKDGTHYHEISNNLKKEEELAFLAVKNNPAVFTLISKEVKNNQNFLFKFIETVNVDICSIKSDVEFQPISDLEFMKKLCQLNGIALSLATVELQSNVDLIKIAINQNAKSFEYAFTKNEEIISLALEKHGLNLQFAKEHQSDRKMVLKAMESNPDAYQFASDELRKDYELSLKAIDFNLWNFSYTLNEEIKENVEIVKKVLESHGNCFINLSSAMKYSKELLSIAMKTFPDVFFQSPESLQKDEELIVKLLNKESNYFRMIDDSFTKNRNIVNLAVRKNGLLLSYASKELKNDKEIVLDAVLSNGSAIQFASPKMKSDKEIVLASIRKDHTNLIFAAKPLREDRDVLLVALKSGMQHEKMKDDMELCWLALYRSKAIREIPSFNMKFHFY
jgi:hypothetical protein